MTVPSFFGYVLSPVVQVAEIWEKIIDFVSTVDSTSIILPISPAINFNDNSMVVVEMEIISKSGTGNNFLLRVNGISSPIYDTDGRTIKAGVEILIDETGTGFKFANPTLLLNVNDKVQVIAYLQLNKLPTPKNIGIQSFANGVEQRANMNIAGVLKSDQTELNEISILPFSVAMGAGSRITAYKVKRKL